MLQTIRISSGPIFHEWPRDKGERFYFVAYKSNASLPWCLESDDDENDRLPLPAGHSHHGYEQFVTIFEMVRLASDPERPYTMFRVTTYIRFEVGYKATDLYGRQSIPL